jgi:hypothetical protein
MQATSNSTRQLYTFTRDHQLIRDTFTETYSSKVQKREQLEASIADYSYPLNSSQNF